MFHFSSVLAQKPLASGLQRRAWLAAGLAVTLGLSACGGSSSEGGCAVNRPNFERLSHNMTLEEVNAVYGCAPKRVIAESAAAIGYVWEGNQTAGAVIFAKSPKLRLTYKNYQDSGGFLMEKRYE